MEQLYQQLIIDHAKDPQGKGLAPDYDAESFQVNPTCGDEVRLRVHLTGTDRPMVQRVSWDGQGCSISQASISVMSELVTGQPVAVAEALSEDFRALMHNRGEAMDEPVLDRLVHGLAAVVHQGAEVLAQRLGEAMDEAVEDRLGDATAFTGVGRYPARIKCALLGWMALRDALIQAGASTEDR